MLEIHLYGSLRRYAQESRPGQDCVIALESSLNETMASLLARMGIPVDEINRIFFNSNLLAPPSFTRSIAKENVSEY